MTTCTRYCSSTTVCCGANWSNTWILSLDGGMQQQKTWEINYSVINMLFWLYSVLKPSAWVNLKVSDFEKRQHYLSAHAYFFNWFRYFISFFKKILLTLLGKKVSTEFSHISWTAMHGKNPACSGVLMYVHLF